MEDGKARGIKRGWRECGMMECICACFIAVGKCIHLALRKELASAMQKVDVLSQECKQLAAEQTAIRDEAQQMNEEMKRAHY